MTPVSEREALMREAIAEAEKARGRTHPNPIVGAIVVKDGVIIGRGHHEKAGAPHAEVMALREAGGAARGAELFVTLEPCNHTGRTPPCTEAILAAGIARVFGGTRDPNRRRGWCSRPPRRWTERSPPAPAIPAG
jgi:diaminohydroxyphosphoribosylaminopyrimidine deaminase/5-amino-6-(5-phosphoribosylamino)uracil reductase